MLTLRTGLVNKLVMQCQVADKASAEVGVSYLSVLYAVAIELAVWVTGAGMCQGTNCS